MRLLPTLHLSTRPSPQIYWQLSVSVIKKVSFITVPLFPVSYTFIFFDMCSLLLHIALHFVDVIFYLVNVWTTRRKVTGYWQRYKYFQTIIFFYSRVEIISKTYGKFFFFIFDKKLSRVFVCARRHGRIVFLVFLAVHFIRSRSEHFSFEIIYGLCGFHFSAW